METLLKPSPSCCNMFQLNSNMIANSMKTGRWAGLEQCWSSLMVLPVLSAGFAFLKLLPPWSETLCFFLQPIHVQGQERKGLKNYLIVFSSTSPGRKLDNQPSHFSEV